MTGIFETKLKRWLLALPGSSYFRGNTQVRPIKPRWASVLRETRASNRKLPQGMDDKPISKDLLVRQGKARQKEKKKKALIRYSLQTDTVPTHTEYNPSRLFRPGCICIREKAEELRFRSRTVPRFATCQFTRLSGPMECQEKRDNPGTVWLPRKHPFSLF